MEQYILPAIDLMKEHNSDLIFADWEIQRMDRIYKDCIVRYMRGELNEMRDIELNRYRFFQFTEQYDKRRETNFLETFPEFKEFYKECKTRNV